MFETYESDDGIQEELIQQSYEGDVNYRNSAQVILATASTSITAALIYLSTVLSEPASIATDTGAFISGMTSLNFGYKAFNS